MNGSRKALCLALLLTSSLPATAEEPLAHWVPADQAVVDGQLVLSAFDDRALFEMERWLMAKLPQSPCEQAPTGSAEADCDMITVSLDHRVLVAPEKVLAEAHYAAFGTVTRISHGLFQGRVATVVTVRPDRWLRSPSQGPPEWVHFLSSDAKISINGIRYCAKGHRKDLLKPGRRVFFGTQNVIQAQPLFLLPYDTELFFETDQGAVSIGVEERPEWSKNWLRFEAQLWHDFLNFRVVSHDPP
jgi:hypothetical protein